VEILLTTKNHPEGLAFLGRVMGTSNEWLGEFIVEQNGKDALLGGLRLF
jgi:hypothetical protein